MFLARLLLLLPLQLLLASLQRVARSFFVLAVAARAGADAYLDRLAPEHLPTGVLQREYDLYRTPRETTHARTEAHELEQVRDPFGASCRQKRKPRVID